VVLAVMVLPAPAAVLVARARRGLPGLMLVGRNVKVEEAVVIDGAEFAA